MTRRARAAVAAVDHYPHGDVLEWAERNWRESVRPYMDEFIAASKNKNAPVADEYFDDNSPAFLFMDVKVMHRMADGMRDLAAKEKSEIMSGVFFPFGEKWGELLSAMERRIGACAEIRSFKTKLSQVADSIKLMFVSSEIGSHVDEVWLLRQAMIEAFGALRERVCSTATADLPHAGRYAGYCCDNETLSRMFGVSVKTIIRWKNENDQTRQARAFRLARENHAAMEDLAARYRRGRENRAIIHRRTMEPYNDAVDYGRRRGEARDK